MARFYGVVGYAAQRETSLGVWEDELTERHYYGELVRNSSKLKTSDQLNDNVDVACEISIVSDPYAIQNFHSIRYAEFMGTNWNVNSVEVRYPRLILTLGGLYNGDAT